VENLDFTKFLKSWNSANQLHSSNWSLFCINLLKTCRNCKFFWFRIGSGSEPGENRKETGRNFWTFLWSPHIIGFGGFNAGRCAERSEARSFGLSGTEISTVKLKFPLNFRSCPDYPWRNFGWKTFPVGQNMFRWIIIAFKNNLHLRKSINAKIVTIFTSVIQPCCNSYFLHWVVQCGVPDMGTDYRLQWPSFFYICSWRGPRYFYSRSGSILSSPCQPNFSDSRGGQIGGFQIPGGPWPPLAPRFRRHWKRVSAIDMSPIWS
jgi:hypothetical protein